MTGTVRTPAAAPDLVVHPARGDTTAVALVLPGGTADSFDPAHVRQLAAIRVAPIARALARRGSGHGLAVWVLRYRYRGWNGTEASPVQDTSWALGEVRRRHGDVPVVLVGHSMGGRTALRVGGEGSVRGVVALAPWLPEGEPTAQLTGRPVLIAHGNLDKVTSARASQRYAERLAASGGQVGRALVCGDVHAMLLRWPLWHRLSTSFVLSTVELAPPSRLVARVMAAGRTGRFAVAV